MKSFEEGDFRTFLEKLHSEEFIIEGIKYFSSRSNWESGLWLHALGASPPESEPELIPQNPIKEVDEILSSVS